jgi:heptosyltransferase II
MSMNNCKMHDNMKILLVQTSFLGDTILSTPVISGIKQIHPGSRLWMMTTPLSMSLVKDDPRLAGVIPYDKRGKDKGLSGLIRMKNRLQEFQFDRVYALHRSARTSLLLSIALIPERICFSDSKLSFLYHQKIKRNMNEHDVLRNLSILKNEVNINSLDQNMLLFAPDKEKNSKNFLNTIAKLGRYVILVPGSAWNTKRWFWQGFQDVSVYLKNKGVKVVLAGAEEDQEICSKIEKGAEVVNLAGKTSISEMLFLTMNASGVICNDSMSLHMASAFKIPTVAVFCSTIPEFGFGPWKNKHRIIEKKMLCRPCGGHGKKQCPENTQACMKHSSKEVIKALKEIIDLEIVPD